MIVLLEFATPMTVGREIATFAITDPVIATLTNILIIILLYYYQYIIDNNIKIISNINK